MTTVDVLIVGAGPAGAAAARLLAAWGHRVLIIDRPSSDRTRMAESLPPSAENALAVIGATATIADAGFPQWRGNTVWWADNQRVETFPAGVAGYQIDRGVFDGLLRDLARDSGAEIRSGRGVEVRATPSPSATFDDEGSSHEVSARIVIDASGRSGVLAKQGLRVHESQPHTIAVAAIWQSSNRWDAADGAHTLIASYADGWAWSIPTDSGARQFTVMVDPSRTERARGASSRDVYLGELAKVVPFGAMLEKAELVSDPWGADATVYSATQYAGPGFLLAGDAGSTIDPLSSFGVKKALMSGWLAAVTCHTTLVNPAMTEEAQAFFNRREHEVVAQARRQAARFAGEAADRAAHPFWTSRAQTTGDPDAFEPDAAALGQDPDVLSAFSDLRARAEIQLTPGPELRIEPRAALRGREIVLDDHLILPRWPAGIRWLRGVDLVALARLAPVHRDIGDLYGAVAAVTPAVALPDFLGALSVLIASSVLRHR